MKKMVFCAILMLGVFGAVAQPQKIQEASSLNYYGIDFSSVRVIAAGESACDFIDVFGKINQLVIMEPEKYNLRKAFRKEIGKIDLSTVGALNEKTDPETLKMYSGSHRLSEKTIAQKVTEYQIPDKEGIGVVLIAEQLDKPGGAATYHVVFFDLATREIVLSKWVAGKAGGFGLRNYWARSVYRVLSKWSYPKVGKN